MNVSWCSRVLSAAFLMGISGCAGTPPSPAEPRANIPPGETTSLAVGSAGYTGCLPEENKISNVIGWAGSETWNATCKGKVYLCSAVASVGIYQGSYSCALAVQ
jgi:hypothetical protein